MVGAAGEPDLKRLTPFLDSDRSAWSTVIIAITSAALTACLFLAPKVITTGLLIGLVAFSIGFVTTHPEFMPEILVIAAYVGLVGVKLEVGSLNLRPNMFIALVGVLPSLRREGPAAISRFFLAANAIYLLVTVLHASSVFFRRGVADCFLLTLNLAQYAIVARAADMERLLRIVFIVASTSYTFLIFLYGLVSVGGFPGLTQQETPEILRLTLLGTTQAAYILFSLVTFLVYLCFFGHPFSKILTLWCLASHFVALALTFSRAAWLALLAVIILFLCFALVRFPLRRSFRGIYVLASITLSIGAFGYWYASRDATEILTERAEAVSLEEGTVVDRLVLWNNMLEDWRNAPLFGHGAHDYAKFRDTPEQVSENYLLELLHSGGIITAGFFLLGIFALGWRAIPWTWSAAVERPWSLPLLAGFAAMSMSALTNPAMTGGIYWIGAGLLSLSALPGRARVETPRTLIPNNVLPQID